MKSLSKKWSRNEKHDVACQSNSLLITPIDKTLFNTNQSPSKVEAESGLEGAEGMNNNYSLENNLFLRAIANKMDTMAICMSGYEKTISDLDTTILQVEKYAVKTRSELSAQIDENARKNEELRVGLGKSYEYTDTKISNLREAIPLALAEVGGNLEQRIDEQNKVLLQKVQEELEKKSVDNLLGGGLEGTFRDTLIKFENQTNQRLRNLEEKSLNIERNTKSIDELKNDFGRDRERTETTVNQHTEQIRVLDGKIKELTDSLNRLKADNTPLEGGGGGFITRHEWRLQKQRTQDAYDRIADIETGLKICSKKTESVDMIVRKCNIIIDQLTEIEGEDIGARVCNILRNTVHQDELDKIRVLRVFRLGVKRKGGPPRKVLLELDNPLSCDLLLSYARIITKSGNDGKPYHLNDDVPDEVRRRKGDIQKYIKYMDKKGHRIEKLEDDLMINGRRWKVDDLDKLPEGQRLMDSRTITQSGKVAFQSSVSPLSNLYHCTIRVDGLAFKSLEHAYNYAKCEHHGLTYLAREVKQQPTSYKAMNLGKGVTGNPE